MVKPLFIFLVAGFFLGSCDDLAGGANAPDPIQVKGQNIEVQKILDTRVNTVKRNIGIAAGIVTPEGASVFVSGKRNALTGGDLDKDTIFEIGSVTKVFTGVLLADMVARGEVKLDDPISRYLPKDVVLPDGLGDKITLLHLVTHTAGFPRNPPNMTGDEKGVGLATYTEDLLFEYLRTFQPTQPVGKKYDYSNVGMGLLGYILAKRATMAYGELLQDRIFKPLGMTDTHIKTSEDQNRRFADPHNSAGEPIPRWNFDVLAGAGAIRSTVQDMLKFAATAAGIGGNDKVMADIMATYQTSYPIPGGENNFFISWIFPSPTEDGENVFWHDGGTGGSRSFLGIVNNEKRKAGVVVLSNTAFSVNDIGLNLLDPAFGLRDLELIEEISLAPEDLYKFLGDYRLSEKEIITITAENGQLYAQITDDGRYPVFPYNQNAFFYKVADAQLIFTMDENQRAVSLTLKFQGSERNAQRVRENQ